MKWRRESGWLFASSLPDTPATLRRRSGKVIGCFPTFRPARARGCEPRTELGAGVDAGLAVYAGEVRLNRLQVHEQLCRDFAVPDPPKFLDFPILRWSRGVSFNTW